MRRMGFIFRDTIDKPLGRNVFSVMLHPIETLMLLSSSPAIPVPLPRWGKLLRKHRTTQSGRAVFSYSLHYAASLCFSKTRHSDIRRKSYHSTVAVVSSAYRLRVVLRPAMTTGT